jgi:glycosyltransferase involved in cell wall biosynthesis
MVDPTERSTLEIPESAIILISINRDARYRQEEFWAQMHQVLKRHPQVYFVAVGLSDLRDLLPTESSVRKQVIAPGFRSDIMELLAMADIYVDLFPSGGGSSIIEAMQAGLPVLCFDQDFSSLYTVRNVSLAPTFVDDSALVMPYGDVTGWQQMMDRLLVDENLRQEIGRSMAEAATKFEPKRVTAEFFDNLETAFRQKQKTYAE